MGPLEICTEEMPHDRNGGWLRDHESYLDGKLPYEELQRRNCERYRSSPPLCTEVGAEGDRPSGASKADQRRRRARRLAIITSMLFAVGLGLEATWVALGQGLIAVIMLQPLVSSLLTAASSIHEWRHLDG